MSSGKEFMDRVKANQVKKLAAEPMVVAEVKVQVMSDNQVRVYRPEGDDPKNLAAIIQVLAAGMNVMTTQLAKVCQGGAPRILTPPPGTRVQ